MLTAQLAISDIREPVLCHAAAFNETGAVHGLRKQERA
jgi:hypothetical protein